MTNKSSAMSQPSAPTRARQTGFRDIETVHGKAGLVAVISQRNANGKFTFAVMKEFDRDGHVERTSFISENMADDYLELVERTIARVRALRAEHPLDDMPAI